MSDFIVLSGLSAPRSRDGHRLSLSPLQTFVALIFIATLSSGCDRDRVDAPTPPLAGAEVTSTSLHKKIPSTPHPKAAEKRDGSPKLDTKTNRTGIGVLLISHGSRSAQWRSMLEDVTRANTAKLTAIPGVREVRTAFMEYTEPSIATQAKALDAAGVAEIVVVPLLLTVSSHSFDDIPTILGQREDAKSRQFLKAEGVVRYTPKARVRMTPLLDFTTLLRRNLTRRTKALMRPGVAADQQGVTVVAYGSGPYKAEWDASFTKLSASVCKELGLAYCNYAWCGHLVHYKTTPTVKAVSAVMAKAKHVLVVPALVARDPMFQDKIIGGAVAEIGAPDRVHYKPDAILPDAGLNAWILDIVSKTVAQSKNSGGAKPASAPHRRLEDNSKGATGAPHGAK